MVELAGIRVWVVSYSYIGGTLQGIPSSTFSAQLETGLEEETTPPKPVCRIKIWNYKAQMD